MCIATHMSICARTSALALNRGLDSGDGQGKCAVHRAPSAHVEFYNILQKQYFTALIDIYVTVQLYYSDTKCIIRPCLHTEPLPAPHILGFHLFSSPEKCRDQYLTTTMQLGLYFGELFFFGHYSVVGLKRFKL